MCPRLSGPGFLILEDIRQRSISIVLFDVHEPYQAKMSLLTDPNSASNEVSMSSEYDIAFEPSDMESFGSSISTDENIPKDYWFGIKYFECIIAQTVLQRTCLLETVARVDVSWSPQQHHWLIVCLVRAGANEAHISVCQKSSRTEVQRSRFIAPHLQRLA